MRVEDVRVSIVDDWSMGRQSRDLDLLSWCYLPLAR